MTAACVADLREEARRRLPRALFDYIDGGSYAERTLAANVEDLAALNLRQRVLRDVGSLSLATEVLGQKLSMPLILAPVGLAGMFAKRGEVQAARAAAHAGVPFTLSTVGVCAIEEVVKSAPAPWFQLYMVRDRGFMAQVLERAGAAGAPVLLFTVDLPVPGARYRDARNAMTGTDWRSRLARALDALAHPTWLLDVGLAGRPHTLGTVAGAAGDLKSLAHFWVWIGRNFDPTVTWTDIAWVRERWSGPILLKGVLDPEDAREARRCGVDGIVVSNHGGRQLDSAPSSSAALPRIAEAAGDEMTVLMDGGVRSGLDVLKALACGAKACLVGRAWAWALGAGGEAGVARMLAILRAELRTAMSLTGCTDVRDAGPNLLEKRA